MLGRFSPSRPRPEVVQSARARSHAAIEDTITNAAVAGRAAFCALFLRSAKGTIPRRRAGQKLEFGGRGSGSVLRVVPSKLKPVQPRRGQTLIMTERRTPRASFGREVKIISRGKHLASRSELKQNSSGADHSSSCLQSGDLVYIIRTVHDHWHSDRLSTAGNPDRTEAVFRVTDQLLGCPQARLVRFC